MKRWCPFGTPLRSGRLEMTTPSRLHHHMAQMVALEACIEKTLDQLSKQASDHPDVAALVRSFHEMSATQRQTLEARLHAVAGNIAIPDRAVSEFDGGGSGYPVSTALRHAFVALNQAIFGYAMLRTIALRFRDSPVAGEEGNTGDIAKQHTENYIGAVHKINQMLHNVVLWEMDREGSACLCTCPCCGLGVCLCAVSARTTLSDAWAEVGPIADEAEVFLQPPRSGSAAANVGLHHRDVIVAVDGQELQSYSTLQSAVRGHQSGEAIELRVRRDSGELEDITIVRP